MFLRYKNTKILVFLAVITYISLALSLLISKYFFYIFYVIYALYYLGSSFHSIYNRFTDKEYYLQPKFIDGAFLMLGFVMFVVLTYMVVFIFSFRNFSLF